ncbi:MAG: hypothetical protein U0325_25085 [Polyangiales bacterium]
MPRAKPAPTPFRERDAVTVATLGARAWRNDRTPPTRGLLDLSPDGRHLAVAHRDGVALLDVDTGLAVVVGPRETRHPRALRFAHRHPALHVVGADAVTRLDPATLRVEGSVPFTHPAHLCACDAVDATGLVVLGDRDAVAALDLRASGGARPLAPDPRSPSRNALATTLAVSPDGRVVARGRDDDAHLTCWRLDAPDAPVHAALARGAETIVFVGDALWVFDRAGDVWTLAAPYDGALRLRWRAGAPGGWGGARVTRDGAHVLVAWGGGVLRFAREGDEAPGRCALPPCVDVCPSHDGRRLWAHGVDGGVHRVDLATGVGEVALPTGWDAALVWEGDAVLRVVQGRGAVRHATDDDAASLLAWLPPGARRDDVRGTLTSARGRYRMHRRGAAADVIALAPDATGRRVETAFPSGPPIAVDDAGAVYAWSPGDVLARWPADVDPRDHAPTLRLAPRPKAAPVEAPTPGRVDAFRLRLPMGKQQPTPSVSRDGARLAVIGRGGLTSVVDLTRWALVATHTFARCAAVAFADRDTLVVLSAGGRVAWHDAVTGALLAATEGARAGDRILAVSHDGARVAVTGYDPWKVRFVARAMPCRVGETRLEMPASCGAFSPDGRRFVVGDLEPVLRVIDVDACLDAP